MTVFPELLLNWTFISQNGPAFSKSLLHFPPELTVPSLELSLAKKMYRRTVHPRWSSTLSDRYLEISVGHWQDMLLRWTLWDRPIYGLTVFTTLLLGCSRSGAPFRDVFPISVVLSLGAVLDWATLLQEEVRQG